MPVDTPGHAALVGYCAGSLHPPQAGGLCHTCGYAAGLTPGGYVGPHVQDPGPRAIVVDEDESMTTMDAVNTPVPGLLIARPQGSLEDAWQVLHAGTGLVLHPPRYHYPGRLATALVCQLGSLGDWLIDAESIRNNSQLAMASQMVCFMAYRELEGHDADQEGGPE